MQQPASTTLNLSPGLSWQARNSSACDGNDNSDAESRDVEPNDLSSSESIGRLIHEGNNGISMNPSPDTSNANSCSSLTAIEHNDHSTASEGTDVIVHEGFENIAVGSTPFALENHKSELNPAELKLANQIIEHKFENASLRSRVAQLEQDNAAFVEKLQQRHNEMSILKTQIDQQQREFQQMKQISAELLLDKVERDLLNRKLYEKMETLERGHQLAQERSAELQTELDKRNEENMRQIDAIKQLTLRLKDLESAEKSGHRYLITGTGNSTSFERFKRDIDLMMMGCCKYLARNLRMFSAYRRDT